MEHERCAQIVLCSITRILYFAAHISSPLHAGRLLFCCVAIDSGFFRFYYFIHKVRWITLSVVFFVAASIAASCGNQQDELAHLRFADVPVRPLLHTSGDPTVTYAELFPLQIAVYWTDPSEGVLGVVHTLRAMGIPFFVTRDLFRASRFSLFATAPLD